MIQFKDQLEFYIDKIREESEYHNHYRLVNRAKRELIRSFVKPLKKVVKENTIMIDDFDCRMKGHDWEPDTSMTVMRCDLCGMGANTYEAKELLKEIGVV